MLKITTFIKHKALKWKTLVWTC